MYGAVGKKTLHQRLSRIVAKPDAGGPRKKTKKGYPPHGKGGGKGWTSGQNCQQPDHRKKKKKKKKKKKQRSRIPSKGCHAVLIRRGQRERAWNYSRRGSHRKATKAARGQTFRKACDGGRKRSANSGHLWRIQRTGVPKATRTQRSILDDSPRRRWLIKPSETLRPDPRTGRRGAR